jgi:glycosyltransferase involved in cell wall biosynthesis
VRVLHFSTTDTREGAAIAALKLHRGLQACGIESHMGVMHQTTSEPNVFKINHTEPFSKILKHATWWRLRRDLMKYSHSLRAFDWEPFSDARTPFSKQCKAAVLPKDLIVLHMVAGFIDWTSFLQEFGASNPIVVVLHDMNTFTGGCHFDLGCGRFRQSCGECPQLGSTEPNDLSQSILDRKRQAFAQNFKALHVVAPSNWIAEQAAQSSILRNHQITVIPYGIDVDTYRPIDKDAIRRAFGIADDITTICYSATALRNRRKGMKILFEAVKRLANRHKLAVIAIGNGDFPKIDNVQVINLGPIQTDFLLARALNAADLFAFPSLQESGGQIALEAMACGIPIVGFANSALPEIIRPGITGQLAKSTDTDGLTEALEELVIAPEKRKELSENCRTIATSEYSIALHVSRHLKLYEDLYSAAFQTSSPKA